MSYKNNQFFPAFLSAQVKANYIHVAAFKKIGRERERDLLTVEVLW